MVVLLKSRLESNNEEEEEEGVLGGLATTFPMPALQEPLDLRTMVPTVRAVD
jgi:hypothetical protein